MTAPPGGEPFLQRLWYRPPSPVARLLQPVSWLYGAAIALRAALYRRGVLASRHPGVPVLVVGNVAAGGTGKTPLTIALAGGLAARGYRPGIACRAWGGSLTVPRRVYRTDDPAVCGDEPVLLASRLPCPVWAGRRRADVALALHAAHPECDVLICDDGLQHHALARDVEIALVDGARGLGNGLLLPAGPLREPACRLERVDAVVINAADASGTAPAAGYPMRLAGERFVSLVDPGHVASAPALPAVPRVAAIAGIGNPARFFAHLGRLGLAFDAMPFPDHHAFRPEDLALPGYGLVLMTEKDAIKCRRFADDRMWALPVDAIVPDALFERLTQRLAACRREPAGSQASP